MSPFNAANLPNLPIATIPVDVVVGSLMSGEVVWRAARVDVVERPLLRHRGKGRRLKTGRGVSSLVERSVGSWVARFQSFDPEAKANSIKLYFIITR